MTGFVVEISEEGQLKNLYIFLKQTGTPPTDILVFLIACFIPSKSNNLVKTITIFRKQRLLSFEDVYFQPS